MIKSPRNQSLPRKRRGAILIVALLCLLVVMSLLGTMLLAALQSTRQLHAERDLRAMIDPSTGRWIVQTRQHETHFSALDPNRNVIDRGSQRTSSSISTDANGNQIESVTTSWTSYGVPHSNTVTRRITSGPNGTVINDTVILKGTNSSTGGSSTNNQVTPLPAGFEE
ncbi:hypothetical protein [Anatilimnocola floriformis]|uniref:hypothetical protein n=1 Tax=Anatilimnocola floriformis TaxID=2948575 RepID=UPI0020C51B6E|nr:hypothetical protein [Anatilimnocola floriformis]